MSSILRYILVGVILAGVRPDLSRAQPSLPPRFTSSVLAENIFRPTQVRLAGDGRIFLSQQSGELRLRHPGQTEFATVLVIPGVVTDQEYGLLAFELAPDFDTSGHIFIFNTRREGKQAFSRVSRFTLVGDAVALSSELVVWRNQSPAIASSHHGAALAFTTDNKLLIATGEQFIPERAPDLASEEGKILRVNLDGSIPADNPFLNVPGARPTIYTKGSRNPFRFAVDRTTHRIYCGEVGSSTYEEINIVTRGADYGWPSMEGFSCFAADCTPFERPFFAYTHQDPAYQGSGPGGANAIILGPVYRGSLFPAEYAGSLFVADLIQGWIKRLVIAPGGSVSGVEPFMPTGILGVVDMTVGPDGALYVLSYFERTLVRIGYSPNGDPPIVAAGSDIERGPTPLSVAFSSAGTNDPDNYPAPLSYSWDFGDGISSKLPNPSHIYQTQGRYHAQLTVSDTLNTVVSTSIEIVAGNAPVITALSPLPGRTYRGGDIINFAAEAKDTEDGALSAPAFSWDIKLMQGSAPQPYLGPITETGGSFEIPTTGRPPLNISYRIDLEITDSDGLPTRTSIPLTPVPSPLTLNTSPPGIPLALDGFPIATPRVYQSLVNFEHTLEAPDTFPLGGRRWNFRSWTSGLPRIHPLVAPENGTADTAVYEPVCVGDFNEDGTLTAADIFAFLQAYFTQDPRADTDANGQITGSDVIGFLNGYYTGC